MSLRPAKAAPPKKARKNKNRKRPDFLTGVRSLLTLALLGEIVYIAYCSPRMNLRQVAVAGTVRTSPAQVMQLAGVKPGRNIFRANLSVARKRIMREPLVRDVRLIRVLPDTVRIEVEERKPSFMVVQDGRFYEADEQGFVFRENGALNPAVPELDVASMTRVAVGGRLPQWLFSAARDCSRLARRDRLNLRRVRLDPQGDLWVDVAVPATEVEGGQRDLPIRLGRSDQLAAKFSDVRATLTGKPEIAQAAAYINVICPGRPAFGERPEGERPKEETATN